MIVQPTPARPPGRRPPVTAVAVGLLAVLAAVIGVATLGPRPEPADPPPRVADEPARATPDAPPPTAQAAIADPDFPAEVLGLPVQDVVSVVDGRRAAGQRPAVAAGAC